MERRPFLEGKETKRCAMELVGRGLALPPNSGEEDENDRVEEAISKVLDVAK